MKGGGGEVRLVTRGKSSSSSESRRGGGSLSSAANVGARILAGIGGVRGGRPGPVLTPDAPVEGIGVEVVEVGVVAEGVGVGIGVAFGFEVGGFFWLVEGVFALLGCFGEGLVGVGGDVVAFTFGVVVVALLSLGVGVVPLNLPRLFLFFPAEEEDFAGGFLSCTLGSLAS